ncbi:hypothetical protein K1719_016165 [Acacia pycnantha]|nr:hypothetical protein K1719_016165 [Acacia pycnantha]
MANLFNSYRLTISPRLATIASSSSNFLNVVGKEELTHPCHHGEDLWYGSCLQLEVPPHEVKVGRQGIQEVSPWE